MRASTAARYFPLGDYKVRVVGNTVGGGECLDRDCRVIAVGLEANATGVDFRFATARTLQQNLAISNFFLK